MSVDQNIEHPRARLDTRKHDELVEFAHRHKITLSVAAAILANAKNIKDADRAVARIRG